MGNDKKIIKITKFNTNLNKFLNTKFEAFDIYRSKGLLSHMMKRNHYTAIKYIDYLADIITNPDYVGYYNENLELVKRFKDNIFISIKIDAQKGYYYVATMYDIKDSKIDSYVKSGRLLAVDEKDQM